MYGRSYCFGNAKPKDGAVQISVSDLYEEGKGYGLLALEKAGEKPDRFTGSGGWYAGDAFLKEPVDSKQGFYDTPWGVAAPRAGFPLRFRAKVPHKGVYRIIAVINGGGRGSERLDIYTGRRNLVKRGLRIGAGEEIKVSFYVHVCEYIPVIGEPMRLDDTVYVTLIEAHMPAEEAGKFGIDGEMANGRSSTACAGPSLVSVAVEEAEAPTVYLAGDSLVCDYSGQYPDNPLMNFGSWGQNLLSFLPGAAVSNQAHGGMTTNCFREDGHFEIVRRNIRPGDVFFMQFGHNDQKRRYLKAYVQYAANLRWYIARIREKGAYPVIVTSLSRIPGEDEEGYFDLLEEYAQSCLRVGKECHVPVIDLHERSFRLMCEAGTEVSRDYFMDVTHTNDYGAMLAARFIASEIVRQKIEPLVNCMEETELLSGPEVGRGILWKPDVSLRPARAVTSEKKEEKPVLPSDLPKLPYADCLHIRQEQELKEAMWKGLLDPCIRYFHPFDVMPRGQFLYLFFKAVPTPKKRSYQGKYCDIYRYEWDASAVQAAIDFNLVDESTTPDGRFRPDDALTGGELVSFMIRSLHSPEKRELTMEECERQAAGLGLLWEDYGCCRAVNRLDCTVALVHLMNVSGEEKKGLPE